MNRRTKNTKFYLVAVMSLFATFALISAKEKETKDKDSKESVGTVIGIDLGMNSFK
jgi:hypothetical protein